MRNLDSGEERIEDLGTKAVLRTIARKVHCRSFTYFIGIDRNRSRRIIDHRINNGYIATQDQGISEA